MFFFLLCIYHFYFLFTQKRNCENKKILISNDLVSNFFKWISIYYKNMLFATMIEMWIVDPALNYLNRKHFGCLDKNASCNVPTYARTMWNVTPRENLNGVVFFFISNFGMELFGNDSKTNRNCGKTGVSWRSSVGREPKISAVEIYNAFDRKPLSKVK